MAAKPDNLAALFAEEKEVKGLQPGIQPGVSETKEVKKSTNFEAIELLAKKLHDHALENWPKDSMFNKEASELLKIPTAAKLTIIHQQFGSRVHALEEFILDKVPHAPKHSIPKAVEILRLMIQVAGL